MADQIMSAPPPVILVPMIGLPASGKTTFCKNLCKFITSGDCPPTLFSVQFLHVEFDAVERDFILQKSQVEGKDGEQEQRKEDATTSAPFDPSTWKEARNEVFNFVKRIVQEKLLEAAALNDGEAEARSNIKPVLLLLDDNAYLTSMRKQYFVLAKELQIGFLPFFYDEPAEFCLLRNAARKGIARVPDFVITNMEQSLEKPDLSKGWESRICSFICAHGRKERCFRFEIGSRKQQVVPKETQRELQSDISCTSTENEIEYMVECFDTVCRSSTFVMPELGDLDEEQESSSSSSPAHKFELKLRGFVSQSLQEVASKQKSKFAKKWGAVKSSLVDGVKRGEILEEDAIQFFLSEMQKDGVGMNVTSEIIKEDCM